jgi:hypothetical protein
MLISVSLFFTYEIAGKGDSLHCLLKITEMNGNRTAVPPNVPVCNHHEQTVRDDRSSIGAHECALTSQATAEGLWMDLRAQDAGSTCAMKPAGYGAALHGICRLWSHAVV